MVEKYFRIKQDSKLYQAYFDWVSASRKIIELFNDFAAEHGIEAREFIPGDKYLWIIPTETDNVSFSVEFTQKYEKNGARQFKRSSKIAKDWVVRVADMPILLKPSFWEYGLRISGSYSQRMFQVDGVLYGSIDANHQFDLLECMDEIKASEFYELLERK